LPHEVTQRLAYPRLLMPGNHHQRSRARSESCGQRGNPVLLGRLLFAIARELRGDEGARRLLTKAPGLRQIKAGSAALRDVDTQREWRAIATTRKALRRVSRESWNANCRCSW
jgi:CTP:molybdopterin cytidylyltransferase MocA